MSALTASLSVTLVALLAEALLGYPKKLFGWVGHPVTWVGGLIGWLDAALNRPGWGFASRRGLGVAGLIVVLAVTVGASIAVQALLEAWFGVWALLPLGLLASSLIAQRSLHDHVAAVADGLDRGLEDGRGAVAQIVGRDPLSLDEAGVARAAIESLAENFSDGIVAPVFYMALAGLPGAAFYKAVNTADSMIGHRTPRHEAYGWAAARLDDGINLPASRLSGALIIAAAALLPGYEAGAAFKAVRRDAARHRSPNAGWPESAMAGALGLRLAGPRIYGGVSVHDHWMGDGRAEAGAGDIRRALRLYRAACALQAAAVAACLLVGWVILGAVP